MLKKSLIIASSNLGKRILLLYYTVTTSMIPHYNEITTNLNAFSHFLMNVTNGEGYNSII